MSPAWLIVAFILGFHAHGLWIVYLQRRLEKEAKRKADEFLQAVRDGSLFEKREWKGPTA